MKLVDLLPMEQELAHPFRCRHIVAGALVGLNVGVIEKGLAFLDPGKGVADVGFAGADRFDLAAFQFDTGLVSLENVKIAQRFAIQNALSGHSSLPPPYASSVASLSD